MSNLLKNNTRRKRKRSNAPLPFADGWLNGKCILPKLNISFLLLEPVFNFNF
jgi:hypothetical protein